MGSGRVGCSIYLSISLFLDHYNGRNCVFAGINHWRSVRRRYVTHLFHSSHPVLLCTVFWGVFFWLAVNFFRRENNCVSVRGFLDTCVCCEIARSVLRSVRTVQLPSVPARLHHGHSTRAPPHTITHIHTVLPQLVAGPRHTSIMSGSPKVS